MAVRETEAVANEILSPARLRKYLGDLRNVKKKEFVGDLEKIGLKLNGASPDGRFMNYVDKGGRIRVKIHPPDKRTNFHHIHIYDKEANPLTASLEISERTSLDSHIPYGGE